MSRQSKKLAEKMMDSHGLSRAVKREALKEHLRRDQFACFGAEQDSSLGCANCPWLIECGQVDGVGVGGAVVVVSETGAVPPLCFGTHHGQGPTMGCRECLLVAECRRGRAEMWRGSAEMWRWGGD